MANVLTNGGLETADITLSGLAERTTAQAFEGSYSLLLRTRKGFQPGTSAAEWPSFTQVVGAPYMLMFRYDGDGSATAPLHIDVDTGSGVFVNAANLTAPGPAAWALSMHVMWEATGTTGRIRMRSGQAVPAIANDVWFVDAVTVTTVDVMRWEAISGVVTALKTIEGSGYHNDLRDSVFFKELFPDQHPDVKMPYLFVAPDVGEWNEFGATLLDENLRLIIACFVKDDVADLRSTNAVQAISELQDDVIKALRTDPTFGGVVRELTVGPLDPVPMQAHDSWCMALVPVTLRLIYQDSDLGP